MNLEVITGVGTAIGTAGAALTAAVGDSLTVKNAVLGSRVKLLALTAKSQVAGFAQLIFPSAHDTTRNMRVRTTIGNVLSRIPYYPNTELQPQELMSLSLAGSAVAGDMESVTLYLFYENLPGINQNLIGLSELDTRFRRLTTVADVITTATGNIYEGARALNAGSDLLKANTDYALLGAVFTLLSGVLTIRGPDTANTRIGIPADPVHPDITGNWFPLLSQETGMDLIPVINSGNKQATIIDVLGDENATAINYSLVLAELAPR